ncbi:MAG: pyruvate kinase, partial [Balneolales bacterium]|nr:pyruvate kinase [Balneolales bacterium]
MKIQPTKIPPLIKELDEVISVLVHAEEEHYQEIAKVHPSYRDGARNLIHYRTFRSLNLKRLQKKLSYLGLSMLGSTESHVLATLINSQQILKSLIREKDIQSTLKGTSIKSSVKQQKKHAKDLFGHSTKGRRVRIMVTLPTEAAYDYKLVHDLLASGMNTARINCAHDGPEVWLLMIQNLHQAKSELKKDCKVFMDLAGPKIRTGSFPKGAKVRKFRPKKNELGEVIQPVSIELVSGVVQSESNALLVDFNWLKSLKEGDSITFKDTRKKRRTLFVSSVQENRVIATCRKTCYVQTGT